jgi:CheY-like chemotaxis protein
MTLSDIPSGNSRMLVVDDEAQVRASFATLLEGDGYKVLQASNGREAQARCRETPVDVAIIDLVMQEQEGLENSAPTPCFADPSFPTRS